MEDVREMAPFVLRHRISWSEGMSVDTVLLDAMASERRPVPACRSAAPSASGLP